MFVPVFDRKQQPLMPTTPSRARRWITSGKATAFWKGGNISRAAQRRASSTGSSAHCCGHRSWIKKRGVERPRSRAYLPEHPGRSQGWGQKSGGTQHATAPNAPGAQDPLPQATAESAAEQEEIAALDESARASETPAGTVPLSALPGACLRGRRHQGPHPGKKALGSAVFAVGGGETLVLCRTRQACPRGDQAGL